MGCKLRCGETMLVKGALQTAYLLGAVLAACTGQFILRIRPVTDGGRIALAYLAASILFYGASFLITALVLPTLDRRVATLVLSSQYPILYLLFSFKESAPPKAEGILAITLGYGLVAIGMLTR